MPRLLAAFAALVALSVTPRAARAQAGLGWQVGGWNQPDPCTGCLQMPCVGVGSAFVQTGVAAFPKGAGLAISAGILHSHLIGLELGLSIPSASESDPVLFADAMLRVRLLREGLSDRWEDGKPAPEAAFQLVLRAGAGIDTTGQLAPAIGPEAQLLLGGSLVIAFRPTLGLRRDDTEPGTHRFLPLPMAELVVGLVLPGAYAD